MHNTAQLLDLFAEPAEFLFADLIMLGIAGLHIGFLQLLEPRPIDMALARPDIGQPPVDPFGLGAYAKRRAA